MSAALLLRAEKKGEQYKVLGILAKPTDYSSGASCLSLIEPSHFPYKCECKHYCHPKQKVQADQYRIVGVTVAVERIQRGTTHFVTTVIQREPGGYSPGLPSSQMLKWVDTIGDIFV